MNYIIIGVISIVLISLVILSSLSVYKTFNEISKLKKLDNDNLIWKKYLNTFHNERTFHYSEEFFTLQSISNKNYSMFKMFFHLPQTALGLGVLGTFIGIAMSTNDLSGIGDISVDAMTNKVDGLLSGMNTAFTTSIIGMSVSIVLSYVTRIIKDKITNQYNELINELDSKYNLDRLENYFTMTHPEDPNRIIRPIELFSENNELAKKNESRMSSFAQDLALALGNQIKESIGVTMEKLVESNSNGAQDVIVGIVENLENSLKSMVHQFKDMISEDTKYELEAMAKMLNSSGEYIQKIPEVLENILQRLSDQHETHLVHYQGVNEELNRGIDIFREENSNYVKTLNSFEKVTDDYDFTVKKHQNIIENINGNMGSTLSALEKSELSISSLEEKLQSISDMHQAIDDVFGVISKNIGDYEEKVGNSLNKYLGEYHNSVDGFSQRLETAILSIKDTVAEVQKIKG